MDARVEAEAGFEGRAGPMSAIRTQRGRAISPIRLVAEAERLGFELATWHDAESHEERLWIRDPAGAGRRPPDWLALAIMAQKRVVCGYLRRIRSPFFVGDHELALSCAVDDDRRLRDVEATRTGQAPTPDRPPGATWRAPDLTDGEQAMLDQIEGLSWEGNP
jgi:hypothetical protein